MTAQEAAGWLRDRLGEVDPGTKAAAAYSMGSEALDRWEEFLDVAADYAEVARKAAELSARHEVVKPPKELDAGLRPLCPVCGSWVKINYYYCPACGQRLRKGSHKPRRQQLHGSLTKKLCTDG